MLTRRTALSLLAILPPSAAGAAAYPSRPVTIVVAFAAGGSVDLVARLVAQALSDEFQQSFIIENRAGAAGTLGHATVARARPDGYTLLMATNSTYVLAPLLYSNIPYDSDTAFTPISQVGSNGQVLCVHPSLLARSVTELIRHLKQNSRQETFGSSGMAGTSHMATELFMSMSGTNMIHVPYRGGGPAAQALMAGEVSVCFVDVATATPLVASGMIRPLGISTSERSPLLPDVPSIADDLPGFQSATEFALLAPAGLPQDLQRQLLAAVQKVLAMPSVRAKLEQQGIRTVASTPTEFSAHRVAETARWSGIIRERKIQPQG